MNLNKGNKRSSTHLLSKTTVALLAIGAAGSVYLLSPSLTSLEKNISDGNSPDVSLAYLQELERVNPNDPMIPYLKAKLLYEKGNFNDAMDLLNIKIQEDPEHRSLDTYILYLKTRVALAENIDNKSKEQILKEVDLELKSLSGRDFSDEQIRDIIQICYSIPDVENAYTYILKIRKQDVKTINETYSLALQTGHYDKALEIKKALYLNNETEEGYKELFSLYVEAFDPKLFTPFLKEYDGKFKDDISFIKAEIDTANRLGMYEESASLLEVLCEKEPSFDNLMLLVQTCVSRQDLDKAKDILEKLYASDDLDKEKKGSVARKLHDVYTWQSDIDNSQRLSLVLLDYDPSKDELDSGVSESRALADMENMGIFYDKSFEKGLISEDEYDDFVDVMEKAYGSDKALSSVNTLLEKDPQNEVLLGHKLRLTSYIQDYDEVINAYLELRKVRVPTSEEALYTANAYVMKGEDRKALNVLTQVENWDEENDDYMIMVSSLAWSCDDDAIAKASQNILLDRNSNDANTYQLLNSIGPISEDNLEKLITYYEKKQDIAIALELLSYSSEKGDYKLLNRMLELVRKHDTKAYTSNSILPYRAAYAMHQRDFVTAKHIYEKMLKNDSSSIEAIDGLCNIALLNGDKKEADALYKKYRNKFVSNPNTWQIAANLASELGYGNEAKAWFEMYLSVVKEPSAVDVLSYASVLEDLGYADKAYRLRRFVVKQKTAELLALDDGNVTLASIISTFMSKDKGEQVLRRELEKNAQGPVTTQYLLTLIERNDIKSAVYLRERTKLADVAINDSQKLLLAVRQKNEKEIERLLENGIGLNDAQKVDALDRISRRLEAYTLAKNTVGTSPSRDENNSLRAYAAANNQDMSRSIQAVYESITHWGLHSYRVNYHAPYSLGQLRLSTVYQTSDVPDQMALDRIENEKRIIGSITYEQDKYDLGVTADLADGLANNRLGLDFMSIYRFDERYSLTFEGGINQNSDVSHMMRVLGKDNVAELSFGANPWGREYFVLTTRYHKYKTRYSEDLGHGYDLEAMAMTPVFNADPALYGYVSALYQKNSLSSDALEKSNRLNGSYYDDSIADLESSSFISKEYKHVAVGLTTNRGDPGVPGPSVPSPRYVFDVFTGYNYTERKLDAGVSGTVGISLFNSQDELFLRTAVQTADRQGDRAFNISVGYSMVF